MRSSETYDPINTLKPVAENVWIIDGPTIRFGLPWPKMRFPTRATLIRMCDGRLFVHSPTPMSDALKRSVEAIGTPSWIIGPNRIHYWWIPAWKAAFPGAAIYLAPRIREQAARRLDFEGQDLVPDGAYPWDGEIDTFSVSGSYMTEFDFFHRSSRTLVLTDLIENFEPHKLNSFVMRLLCRWGGVLDPDGGMPKDMRYSFRHSKAKLKAMIEQMIACNPQRIILAHGRWYDRDGANELRRAFRWLFA